MDDHDAATGRRLVRRSLTAGALACAVATTFAVGIVVTLLVVVLPTPDGTRLVTPLTIVLAASYYAGALAVGIVVGVRRNGHRLAWLRSGRTPDTHERRRTVGIPFSVARLQAGLWLVAAVLFAGLTAGRSVLLAVEVAITVLIGGLASSAVSFLLVEIANRPVIARALDGAELSTPRSTGVALRATTVWLLGTALPLVGLVVLAGLSFVLDVSRSDLALSAFVLGLVSLVVGATVTVLWARTVAHPLKTLRTAVTRLGDGDVGVRVAVTDAGELGVLQTAFNELSAGLEERDRLRDLFGRHVGGEVARRALEEGVELGGEERDVVVLFIDVAGSTALAERVPPSEVVRQLNDLFHVVVTEVERTGGTVTAFGGDAAVCVWNAPDQHDDPESAALRCARAIAGRLAADSAALPVGIGVAGGTVVAGNVGSRDRLEYTVIGDAVNRAARLSDLAKSRQVTVLIDADLLATSPDEDEAWDDAGTTTLRGRSSPTTLAVPSLAGGRPAPG